MRKRLCKKNAGQWTHFLRSNAQHGFLTPVYNDEGRTSKGPFFDEGDDTREGIILAERNGALRNIANTQMARRGTPSPED